MIYHSASYVFLDFDGVLNTEHHRERAASTLFQKYGMSLMDPSTYLTAEDSALLLVNELVERVNRLVKQAGPKAFVVASTEWRKRCDLASLNSTLKAAGATFKLSHVTPVMGDRHNDISRWLQRFRRHYGGLEPRYVALDDTPLPNLVSVRVRGSTGITDQDVEEALTALRAQR